MLQHHHVLEKFKERRGCTVPSPLSWPSNQKIRWHRNVYDDRHIGWLQHPVGNSVCLVQPARGHHTDFILSYTKCIYNTTLQKQPTLPGNIKLYTTLLKQLSKSHRDNSFLCTKLRTLKKSTYTKQILQTININTLKYNTHRRVQHQRNVHRKEENIKFNDTNTCVMYLHIIKIL